MQVAVDSRCEGMRHSLGTVDLIQCATLTANAGKDFFSYTVHSRKCDAHDVTDEQCSGAAMETSPGTHLYRVANEDDFFRVRHEVLGWS